MNMLTDNVRILAHLVIQVSWKRTDHRPMDGHDPKCANLRALPAWVRKSATQMGR